MVSTEKRDMQLEWVCRILITVDVIAVCGGYLSYFQTKNQLVSPLIPKSLVYQIMSDTHVFVASLICAIPFLAGLWFYSSGENVWPLRFLRSQFPCLG